MFEKPIEYYTYGISLKHRFNKQGCADCIKSYVLFGTLLYLLHLYKK